MRLVRLQWLLLQGRLHGLWLHLRLHPHRLLLLLLLHHVLQLHLLHLLLHVLNLLHLLLLRLQLFLHLQAGRGLRLQLRSFESGTSPTAATSREFTLLQVARSRVYCREERSGSSRRCCCICSSSGRSIAAGVERLRLRWLRRARDRVWLHLQQLVRRRLPPSALLLLRLLRLRAAAFFRSCGGLGGTNWTRGDCAALQRASALKNYRPKNTKLVPVQVAAACIRSLLTYSQLMARGP